MSRTNEVSWLCWAVMAVSLTLMGQAEARQLGTPKSQLVQLPPVSADAQLVLPAIDAKAMRDRQAGKSYWIGPVQFAEPNQVSATPDDSGQWNVVPGGRLWRLRVSAPGATDLNFGFSQFQLPAGATLYLISDEALTPKYFQGPFTAADNRNHREFWSPILPGDSATIELFVPETHSETVPLTLAQVGAGFLDAFEIHGGPGLKNHGACNNDVICQEADAWRDQIRSVARYTIGGTGLCTGTMVMDTSASFTPFFVTAFHCSVNAGNAATVVTYWNYESPACGDLGGGSLDQSVSGATYLAGREDVDSTLLQLSARPPDAYNVYWSGWDRSGGTPGGSVGIHHPRGDVKSISFNSAALTSNLSCIGTSSTLTHWTVDDWEDGTTEPGSSGSGIWDPSNQLLVGFLSGGSAACSVPNGSDCYGKFSVAWSGGNSDAQRFSSWLDSANTGVFTIDGGEPESLPPDPLCSTPNAPIPDNDLTGISDEFSISNSGTLLDLNVRLTISHTWVGDVRVELTHVPSATTAVLLDRPGAPATTNGCGNDNIDVTLDDAASASAENACAATPPALAGTLSPTEQLAAFNSRAAAGPWRLTVSDAVAVDVGRLLEWCLEPITATSADVIFSDGFE